MPDLNRTGLVALALLTLAVRASAQPGTPITDQDRAFIAALKSENLAAVKTALDQNPDRAKKTLSTVTALYLAIRGEGPDAESVVSLLLDKGADPNFCGPGLANTPLTIAIRERRTDLLPILLKRRADPNKVDAMGLSPLETAIQLNDPAAVLLLIQNGLDLDRWNSRGLLPVHLLADSPLLTHEIVLALHDRAADLNAPTRGGWAESYIPRSPEYLRPLHIAARSGKVAAVQEFAGAGALVNTLTAGGDTPLHFAARYGPAAVPALLALGADPYLRNTAGDTPLLAALRFPPPVSNNDIDRTEALKALIRVSDISRVGQLGLTPLQLALQSKDELSCELLRARSGPLSPEIAIFDAAARDDTRDLVKLLKTSPALVNTVWPSGWTPLHVAVRWNAANAVEFLLKYGADRNARDGQALVPLQRALESTTQSASMRRIVELLTARPIDVNVERVPDSGPGLNPIAGQTVDDTPLVRAIKLQDLALVQTLLQKGAKINGRDIHGDTPLLLAAKTGASAVIPALLNAGAEVDAVDGVGFSALFRAVDHQDTATIKLLLAKGANPNLTGSFGITPVFYAVTHANLEILKLLVAAGGDVKVHTTNGETTVLAAKRMGNNAVVDYLKSLGAEPTRSAPSRGDLDPIFVAARKADINLIRTALADPTAAKAVDSIGETALHLLFTYGYSGTSLLEPEKLLLDAGADPLAVTRSGRTVLHYAAACILDDGPEAMAVLLTKGAEVNARDKDGLTPLHLVYRPVRVKYLLEHGADPNAQDVKGNTPLHAAAPYNHQVLEALLAGGANPNLPNLAGDLPLHLALRTRQFYGLRLLVEVTDLNVPDSKGLTAFQTLLASAPPDLVATALTHQKKLDPISQVLAQIGADNSTGLQQLLRQNPSLAKFRLPNGITPLHVAARLGAVKCARLLLTSGAEVNARDAAGATPLLISQAGAWKRTAPRDTGILNLLLDYGADPNAMDTTSSLPLGLCIASGDMEGTRILLERGANPRLCDGYDWNAIHQLVMSEPARPWAAELIPLIVEKGADINARGHSLPYPVREADGSTPLILAVSTFDDGRGVLPKLVDQLLKSGALLALRDDAGNTALHHAVVGSHAILSQLLASPDAPSALQTENLKGQTPLALARDEHRREAHAILRDAIGGTD